MARQLCRMYRHMKEQVRDSRKVADSWKRLEREVKRTVSEPERENFTLLLVQHSENMEYQGFIRGFRLATLIWKEGSKDVF